MRVGILAPLYDTSADRIADFGLRAERSGLDGVFVFDGAPFKGRTAYPVFDALDTVVEATSQISVGTLVARAGDDRAPEVIERFNIAHVAAGDRLVAGLGAGDAAAFEAEGRPVMPFAERITTLSKCAERLQADGIEVWLGGRSSAIDEATARLGLSQNLWEPEPGELAVMAAVRSVTWGGRVEMSREAISAVLEANTGGGAKWCVFLLNGSAGSPEHAVELLAETVAGTDIHGS